MNIVFQTSCYCIINRLQYGVNITFICTGKLKCWCLFVSMFASLWWSGTGPVDMLIIKNISHQTKAQSTLVNPTKYSKKILYLFSYFSKYWRGRNVCKLILWSQYYFETKTRQWYYQKRENYRPLSLMSIDIKILKKIITNWIQDYFKRITYHDQIDSVSGV